MAEWPITVQQTVAPIVDAVSIEDARGQVHIRHHDEDATLARYIQAATREIEHATRRQLITATYEAKWDTWPNGGFLLPRPPLLAVSSITYVDTDGETQTVDSGTYEVDNNDEPGSIHLAWGQTWPAHRSHPRVIAVTYTAGYGTTPADVPADYRQAVLMLVSQFYYDREAGPELPPAVRALLADHARCFR